jgi:Trm5-related predicted tRNA methylase
LDENRLRDELIEQLRTSLSKSWEMITDPHLDATTRERWTQIHTRAALALNQILADRQNKDWEERLQEVEAAKRVPLGPTATSGTKKAPERGKPKKTVESRQTSNQSERGSGS